MNKSPFSVPRPPHQPNETIFPSPPPAVHSIDRQKQNKKKEKEEEKERTINRTEYRVKRERAGRRAKKNRAKRKQFSSLYTRDHSLLSWSRGRRMPEWQDWKLRQLLIWSSLGQCFPPFFSEICTVRLLFCVPLPHPVLQADHSLHSLTMQSTTAR